MFLYKKSIYTILLGALVTFTANSAILPQIFNNSAGSLAPMLKKVMPAVVNIRVINKNANMLLAAMLKKQEELQKNPDAARDPKDKQRMPFDLGSGVIVDSQKGYIITNHHVINNAQEIIVTLADSSQFPAKLIGSDPESDVALLQINAPNLTSLKIADSSKAEIGDFVVAIGNPFGLNQTATAGIISAMGRNIGIEGFEDFIQTDAPINPGNSGGALVNMNGELLGINTAILSPEGSSIGIGFAIPSNMMSAVMQQLINYGAVRRGSLGVLAQNLTPDLATAFNLTSDKGAVVVVVLPDSVAANAKLKVGDVITHVNGNMVNNSSDLRNTIGLIPVGEKIDLTILRNNQQKHIKTTIQDPKSLKSATEKIHPTLAGMSLAPIEKTLVNFGKIRALEIISLSDDSIAARAGLHSGDIIYSVFNTKVASLDDVQKAVEKHPDKPLLLQVIRKDMGLFMVLKEQKIA